MICPSVGLSIAGKQALLSTMMTMLTGGCYCRFVRYRIDASPFHEANCHCTMCRRTSGAPFVTWFTIPREAFTLASGEPSSFSSSEHATRTFCPRCGTPLTFSSKRELDEIDVTVSSLDEPAEVPPKSDIYIGSKLPWVVLDDRLPHYSDERSAEFSARAKGDRRPSSA
jgi:hypothetical protein